MTIKEKISLMFQKEFKRKIKELYLYFFWSDSKPPKYLKQIWKKGNYGWRVGEVVPLYAKKGKIAWYEITRSYYQHGDSMSDWALGDDGRYRNFKLVKITNLREKT